MTESLEPRCMVCGTVWSKHDGPERLCALLIEAQNEVEVLHGLLDECVDDLEDCND